ncbi:GNAT family N-acetyltransferase [Roseixanthobacter glucoisosaccharinicivorans]|uniref:GNAT family N-acetyltransferase n=1 Tax=Roseixanthobacter glucoisosaccharinicivorans TaxID=3119923 RepID=UPI00372BAA4B
MTAVSFALPAGVQLRAARAEDRVFLEDLFIAVRRDTLAAAGWPEAQLRAFLADQYRLQQHHYATHYPGAAQMIIARDERAIGLLHLHATARDLRVVDIALHEESRNAGLGAALLRAVCAQAAGEGRTVSLHVAIGNPACRLYQRLGFQATDPGDGVYQKMVWQAEP